MASSLQSVLLLSILLVSSLSFTTKAKTPSKLKALFLPVTKDALTLQYITHLKQRTPFVSPKLVLDLGGQSLWVNCEQGYNSSTYLPVQCGSAVCTLAKAKGGCGVCHGPNRPGCNDNTCAIISENTILHRSKFAEVSLDVMSLQLTNGRNPGPYVSIPRFIFSCGSTFILQKLAAGVTGMAGLGRSKIALPLQLAKTFGFAKKFAICLASSAASKGVIFFGDGPYMMLHDTPHLMLPSVDISSYLTYTPLLVNNVSTAVSFFTGEKSTDYFIGVKSILIEGKPVPLNTTLLKINTHGLGGTKISTVHPYTVMETSIYKAFIQAYVKAATYMKLTRVASIASFKACFSSKKVFSTPVGPVTPRIDLVLQNKHVIWRIVAANSMVNVGNHVMCLAFVDGGIKPRTSIIIGGHQLEDNLLQFDLKNSRLGFSSSVVFRQTKCANFNFTSVHA